MLDNQLAKKRLQQLTDVIFAMSLVLMMSNVEVPKFSADGDINELTSIILDNLLDIGIYLFTFIIIAIHWLKNIEMFSVVKEINKYFIWLQLILLAFIMLLPLTNLFVTVDDKNQLVLIVYSTNLLFIGVTTWLSWRNIVKTSYSDITHHDKKSDKYILEQKVHARYRESLTEPTVALLSIPAAIFSVVWWELTFTLVPIVFMFRETFFKK
jgi:uncharacterized membrane protein